MPGYAPKRASRSRTAGRTVSLRPVPPFRLDATVAVLRRDIRNPVDRWDGERYERVLDLPEGLCSVSARQVGPPESPRLDVDIAAERDDLVRPALRTIRTMLGVDLDLGGLYALADRDARLHRMVEPLRGMKPPRLASVFEALVSAVACQQLSLSAGMTIMARLADRLGRRPPAGDRGSFACPRPDALAATSQDELRALGFSHAKARTLIGLARAVADGALDLDSLARESNAAGPWHGCEPCRASGPGVPSTRCCVASGAWTSFRSTTSARRTRWRAGSTCGRNQHRRASARSRRAGANGAVPYTCISSACASSTRAS